MIDLESLLSWIPLNNISVTAIDYKYIQSTEQELLLIGLESGDIQVWTLSIHTNEVNLLITVPTIYAHSLTVKRIKWKPNNENSNDNILQFASCSEDNTVRVMNLLL